MKTIPILILALSLTIPALSASSGSRVLSVQVQNGQLRATPSFLGKVIKEMAYRTQVELVKEQGDWIQVKATPSLLGWVHRSAVTAKRIAMSSGSGDAATTASGDELALAGKGFNSDVEAQFKARNKTADFAPVDKMGKIVIPPQELSEFLNSGAVGASSEVKP
jgi:SH3-like domain-containing protein